jgi:hypothetical protein
MKNKRYDGENIKIQAITCFFFFWCVGPMVLDYIIEIIISYLIYFFNVWTLNF